MSATTNWRKGKEKSTIDYNKLDSFIELALSKFEYKEPLSALYQATGSHAYYIINNNSLTPDLVIFNEVFNKNVCFYDFKGGSYNPFPRKKFNIEQKKRKNFDKSNLQQDDLNSHGSYEEEPQWVDVEIGELDKVDLQFQSLPYNPNTESYGREKLYKDRNKEENSINLSNLEENEKKSFKNEYTANASKDNYEGYKDNEYGGEFNMGIFCDQNESSIINPENNTSQDYGFNLNSYDTNKNDGFLESMSQIRSTLIDPNIDHKLNNSRGISAFQYTKSNENESFNDKPEISDTKSRKSSFNNQASIINNFNLNLICGDKRLSKDLSINNTSNLESNKNESDTRKQSVDETKISKKDEENKTLRTEEKEHDINNLKEVAENQVEESDHASKTNKNNSESKNYYVNNNFTNIQINMTPNLMGGQMNFPFHLLNYNMPFNPYMRQGYNANIPGGMPTDPLNNVNSNDSNVQTQEKAKVSVNEALENLIEQGSNTSKLLNNASTNTSIKDNKYNSNNNMFNNNMMFLQNMQYNNQMQAYMSMMQQGQSKDSTLNQTNNFDSQFIENPSAVIVKNMYLKNWFVLTEKDKLINFSSIELLDFLEMYYKAEKKYEILHINDYQSDMYFNPVTLLEYLREIVPSFKFKMPNPSAMMFHQMGGMFKGGQGNYNKSNNGTGNNYANSNSTTGNLHKGSTDVNENEKGFKNNYNTGYTSNNYEYNKSGSNFQKPYTVNNITIEEDKRKKFKVYPSSQAYKNKKS